MAKIGYSAEVLNDENNLRQKSFSALINFLLRLVDH